MLLGANLSRYAGQAGRVAVLVCAALFAGWLVSTWLQGDLELEAVHAGYLLPTVAAGLVGGDAAAAVDLPAIGWAAFGVGLFFWAVITTVILLRIIIWPTLPDALTPTLAILLAPPRLPGWPGSRWPGRRRVPVRRTCPG